jgi:addiction module HigA family antidote
MPEERMGELLKRQFLEKYHITQYELALRIKVTHRAIAKIMQGKQRITVGMSLRLGRYFGVADDFFVKKQIMIDMEAEKEALRDILTEIPCVKDRKNHRGKAPVKAAGSVPGIPDR